MMNMHKLGTVSPCYCSLTDKQKAIKTKYCDCFFIHYAYIAVNRTGTEIGIVLDFTYPRLAVKPPCRAARSVSPGSM